MSAAGPLAGAGVLITRPVEQSAKAARLIEGAGGRAILFPAIEIRDVADPAPLETLLDRLDTFDLAVFVSPTAVARAMPKLLGRGPLPQRLRLATVGKGSARELARFGMTDVIVPGRGADSEALLERPELQDVVGQRIIVFRGEGGRELLAESLCARGAEVVHAECYRRVRPEADASPLVDQWRHGGIRAVSVTSSEGLRNLAALLGEAGLACLRQTPLFVIHRRIADTARSLGLEDVSVTEPGDEALIEAVIGRLAPQATPTEKH